MVVIIENLSFYWISEFSRTNIFVVGKIMKSFKYPPYVTIIDHTVEEVLLLPSKKLFYKEPIIRIVRFLGSMND